MTPGGRAAPWLAIAAGVALSAGALGAQAPPPDGESLLVLVSPNAPAGQSLNTRRPLFVWRSAPVPEPPGPWRYDLAIINAGTGAASVARQLADTSYVPPVDLEVNTSYRWAVTARLTTGDSVRVESLASFVIVDESAPLATLLYQNFPNPFPTPESPHTCVWFDLRGTTRVSLDVYDIRGNHVRSLAPGPEVESVLPPGRYGRSSAVSNSGCDPRFVWDGRAGNGREVPPGVYLLRLRAGDVDDIRKVLFRGR